MELKSPMDPLLREITLLREAVEASHFAATAALQFEHSKEIGCDASEILEQETLSDKWVGEANRAWSEYFTFRKDNGPR